MLNLGMEQLNLIDLAQENDDLLPPCCDYVFPEFSQEKKCPRFEDFRMWNNPLFDSPSLVNITLKLDGFDETQTKDGGFPKGNFSSSSNQQTLGNAQGSENSFLRQSLDWNPAFFMEQGLLNSYELVEYTNATLPKSSLDPSFPKCKTKVMSCHQMQGYTSSSMQERSGKRPLHQMHSTANLDSIKKPMKRTLAGTYAGHLLKHQQLEAASQKKIYACPTSKRAQHPNDISNKQCNRNHISLSSSLAMTQSGQRFNASIRVEPKDRSRGNSNKKVDNLYCKRLASQQSNLVPSPVLNARASKGSEKFNLNQPNTDSARDMGSFAQTISSVSRCIKDKLGKVLADTKTMNTNDKHQSRIPKDDSAVATPMSGASPSICHSVNVAYELWPSSNMKSGQVSHALELCTSYTDDSSSIFHSSLSARSSFGTFSSQESSTCSFSPRTNPLRKGHIDIISSENDHLLPLKNLRARIQCVENSGITSHGVDSVGYDPCSFPNSYRMLPFDVKPCTACCKYKQYASKPTRLRLPSPTIGYFSKDNISSLCSTCKQAILMQYMQTNHPCPILLDRPL